MVKSFDAPRHTVVSILYLLLQDFDIRNVDPLT